MGVAQDEFLLYGHSIKPSFVIGISIRINISM